MARQTVIRCDVCRKPCKEIVAKLFFVPLAPRKQAASNYTYLADVGECCAGEDKKILKLLNFRPRQTQKEYHKNRRKAS